MFSLTKVFKLRLEDKNQTRFSIIAKKSIAPQPLKLDKRKLIYKYFQPAEQLYLIFLCLFSLTKVFKLRLESKNQTMFSIIIKKINNSITIKVRYAKLIFKYFHTLNNFF